MSKDLLAEFDSFYQPPRNNNQNEATQTKPQSTSAFDDLSFFGTPSPATNTTSLPQSQWSIPEPKHSDDVWGEFSSLDTEQTQRSAIKPNQNPRRRAEPARSKEASTNQPQSPPKTRYEDSVHERYRAKVGSLKPNIIRTSTEELFSGINIADLAESAAAEHRKQNSLGSPLKDRYLTAPKDMEVVLFDAADELGEEGEEDDFGDFETVSAPAPQIDLLQLEEPIAEKRNGKRSDTLSKPSETLVAKPYPYPQAPKSPSFRERNPFEDLALSISAAPRVESEPSRAETPVTAWPVYEPELPRPAQYHDSPAVKPPDDGDDEDWGDFADLPAENLEVKQSNGIEADAWAWDTIDSHSTPAPQHPTTAIAPTNIPPPSVLLTLFPPLFNLPQSYLFTPTATQPFTLKNRILSDSSTITFLRGYIAIAVVAARVIAGRKLRWKRDTHLSQAMSIGPAAAHGKGGMKLTGVDRSEAVREEREAADLVRVWREQVGRLRSAVAAANSSVGDQAKHLLVPEISEVMVVKAEGVLSAPKACALCGLKREERIVKVDGDVEDSFGEWWVEHWGHRGCRNFWEEHEGELKHR